MRFGNCCAHASQHCFLVLESCEFINKIDRCPLVNIWQVVRPTPFGRDKQICGLHVSGHASCNAAVPSEIKMPRANGGHKIRTSDYQNTSRDAEPRVFALKP